MSLFENTKCPVCRKAFEEEDDIVVCPECGTPHHRECYNMIGRCVNQGLHKTGFCFKEDEPVKTPEAVLYPPNSGEKERPAESSVQPFPFGPVPDFGKAYANDNAKIDGESISDFATAVKTNVPRFINVFKRIDATKRKISWNWGAFFFGSLYFFFRKMYRQAMSVMMLFLISEIGSNLLLAKFAPNTVAALQEIALTATEGKIQSITPDLFLSVQNASDYANYSRIYAAFFAVMLIIRIVLALFADNIYKKNITSVIKNVNQQLNSGASFGVPFSAPEQMNFNQETLRKMYLARKGGVSFASPIAAVLVLYLLLSFL